MAEINNENGEYAEQLDLNNEHSSCDATKEKIFVEDELGLNDDKEAATHLGLSFLGLCTSLIELLQTVPPLIRSVCKKCLVFLRLCWRLVVKFFVAVLSKLHIFVICGRALWKLWILIVRLEVYILTVGTHIVVPKACVEDNPLLISE